MMDFKDLNLKIKYRSSDNDIAKEFYVPVLSCARVYKRAVGFFTSSSLIEVSKGINGILANKGTIQLIASPKLQEKDLEAINKGYKEREKVINDVLLKSIYEPKNYFEEERLNLLCHLIEHRRLDIKIAFLEYENTIGLYHEKIGVLHDFYNNKIAFTGSLNESLNSISENFESIDVYFSWQSESDKERIKQKEMDFDNLWNNNTKKIKVLEFPRIVKDKLKAYMKGCVNINIDAEELSYNNNKKFKATKIPDSIKLYDFQKEAIDNWESNNFKGIFSMATGTGKTITGLAAIVRLSEVNNYKLGIIIVCPYQHLVEQWVEDIYNFNLQPIIGHSASKQKNWKKDLKIAITNFNLNIINSFCLVTTNSTYVSEFVQEQLKKLKNNVVIVVDEAHYFGAFNIRNKLMKNIPYRLALSATFERHLDDEGTQELYNYFGKVCINYSIKRAIHDNMLTPYYYYPILTFLTSEEYDEYKQLTDQLSKCYMKKNDGKYYLNEKGKKISIKRARVVAGSINKVYALKEEMKNYINESYILVYCGATTIEDIEYNSWVIDESEIRQIRMVTRILGNELDMKVSQFTSEENANEREVLKKEFATGENLQALVAIKCLDEGVNIPNIKVAFLLASSTNPKEYIQRRGRVLRLAKNKNYAIIYDFITLPRDLGMVKNVSSDEVKYDISLINKEIDRMNDFAEIARNPQDSYELIKKIKDVYDL